MLRKFSVVVLAAVTLLAAPAFAQGTQNQGSSPIGSIEGEGGFNDKGVHTRPLAVSVLGFLPYSLGIGVAGRVTLPIINDGFLQEYNDSFEIELGADLAFGTYAFAGGGYMQLSLVPAEARWTLHFTPQLDAFAKLGVGYTLYFSSYTGVGAYANSFYLNPALGVIYKLGDKFGLRAEGGYHGLKAGINLDF
jgi:hypothetical protein